MKSYPNRLVCTKFDQDYIKLTKKERQASRAASMPAREKFTNLYVERLPYHFKEDDVMDLFQEFTPLTCIVKKPMTNVFLADPNHLPCSAYISFRTEQQAKMCIEKFNGQAVESGGNYLRLEPYQRSNRFFGNQFGLPKEHLVNNTHFRVLFIKGLFKTVSKD